MAHTSWQAEEKKTREERGTEWYVLELQQTQLDFCFENVSIVVSSRLKESIDFLSFAVEPS